MALLLCFLSSISGLLLCLSLPSLGSTNFGSIDGTVIDPADAVVVGAAVRVQHLGTGVVFETRTRHEGIFWFPDLPTGTYDITVQSPGFATWIQKNVTVAVGARISVTVALKLATTEITTTVNDELPLLETTRTQVSTTIGRPALSGLPVNGRSFLQFVLLTPGVSRGPFGSPSFTGQRGMYSLLADGADNNNTFIGEALGFGADFNQYSLDTVQEFQIDTNSYSAEFGRAGSSVVNMVTKSGTNRLHGSAFWYYRDRSLNATDFVNKINGLPKSPYHFNQFGGTLGGPVRKDQLFFFVGYEAQRSAAQNQVVLNLPSAFTISPDPTVAAFQETALGYLSARSTSWVRTLNQDLVFLKGDWSLTPHHLLTGRWNRQRLDGEGQEAAGRQVSFEHTGASLINTDTFVTTLTSTFGSSWVNVGQFSYARYSAFGRTNSANAEANIFEGGQLVLAIGRNPSDPNETAIRRFEWSDTLSHSHGRHLVKAGFDFLRDQTTYFTALNFSGSYRFNSLASFGSNLAGVYAPLSGERYVQAFSGQGTSGTTGHPDIFDFAGFIEDEWRLRPSLTLSLGLRYDLETLARARLRNPSPALAAAGLDTSFVPTDTNNFAPRLGIAWMPLRNRPLLLRAGYGMFYARTPSDIDSRAQFQNGLSVQTRTFVSGTSASGLIPQYPNNFCGPSAPSGIPPNCPAPISGAAPPFLMLFDRRYIEPVVHQASLGIELQLGKNTAVSASYLLARGVHLLRVRDVNLSPPVPASIPIAKTNSILTFLRFNSPRPIVGFDRIFLFESEANSIYHGLAIQVTQRFANHFQFLCSYTWSKVIDDRPDPGPISPPGTDGALLSDPYIPRTDRARGITDQRHRLSFSGLWDLDYTRRLPSVPRMILSDWHLSGILTAQSGQPYSAVLNFDLNNDGNLATDRTPGLGRNTFTLPSAVSLDLRVTRTVPLKNGRERLEFSWEAFNVFNRVNVTGVRAQQFAVSSNVADCGTGVPQCLVPQVVGLRAFGTPTATSSPRIMQMSVRVVF